MANLFRRIVNGQVALCKAVDERFFKKFSVDGNKDFIDLVRSGIGSGLRLAEVGGGKTPIFGVKDVNVRGLSVTGVDMDVDELLQAAPGSYSRLVVSKIEDVRGGADHDVVIAQSVFEHVSDGQMAILGAASLLRPGGKMYSFCPSRRAWFARLNLLLPERLKRTILFGFFPEKKERQGFPAFYSGCTPAEFRRNLEAAGLEVVEFRPYFVSSYFMFAFPVYLFWRISTLPLMHFWPFRYCETFSFVARKKA